MPRLNWDKEEDRKYETGVSNGVLYVRKADGTYDKGVAWNGLINVTESPEGAEETALYADNMKYLSLFSNEEFKASIEAYTYPDEFEQCDGTTIVKASAGTGIDPVDTGVRVSQQARNRFALCYKTKIGNAVTPELGYKIHIIYGAAASPAERAHDTINDTPEAQTFSWDLTTVPVEVEGYKPISHIVIDSTKANPTKLAALLDKLWGKGTSSGTGTSDPELVMPEDVIADLSPDTSTEEHING